MFARAGDIYVVFVWEPCNLFDPSSVKVGLSRTGVYTFWGYLEATRPRKVYLTIHSNQTNFITPSIISTFDQSRIDYKSVRDFAIKCSVFFLRIMQLLRNNYL